MSEFGRKGGGKVLESFAPVVICLYSDCETHLANFLGTFAMEELSTHSQGKTHFTYIDSKLLNPCFLLLVVRTEEK